MLKYLGTEVGIGVNIAG